jgi:hypothetical protein
MREWRDLAVCAVMAGVTTVASAQEIFKCVSGAGTSYQSTPCTADAFETRLAPTSVRTDSALPAPPRGTGRSPARRSGPWKHTTLTLGMSDDEVLNMAGWGRPGRITRNRLPREWREEWVYGAETLAERRLYFSNGKLIDFGARPADDRVAVSSLQ